MIEDDSGVPGPVLEAADLGLSSSSPATAQVGDNPISSRDDLRFTGLEVCCRDPEPDANAFPFPFPLASSA